MNDSISRQAAIDAVLDMKAENRVSWKDAVIDIIDELPSTQPEIIRCKDCKWWDKPEEDSPFGYCMAAKHGYMSPHWEIGIYRRYKGDFYCADAEKEDE